MPEALIHVYHRLSPGPWGMNPLEYSLLVSTVGGSINVFAINASEFSAERASTGLTPATEKKDVRSRIVVKRAWKHFLRVFDLSTVVLSSFNVGEVAL